MSGDDSAKRGYRLRFFAGANFACAVAARRAGGHRAERKRGRDSGRCD
jgi:hypothetical protein